MPHHKCDIIKPSHCHIQKDPRHHPSRRRWIRRSWQNPDLVVVEAATTTNPAAVLPVDLASATPATRSSSRHLCYRSLPSSPSTWRPPCIIMKSMIDCSLLVLMFMPVFLCIQVFHVCRTLCQRRHQKCLSFQYHADSSWLSILKSPSAHPYLRTSMK